MSETDEQLYSPDWTDERLAAELAADVIGVVVLSGQDSHAKAAEVCSLILAALRTR